METIRIDAASGTQRCWYDDYRRLRHRVFVIEQGWSGLTSAADPGLTPRDPADDHALFWLAWSPAGELVGAVRVRGVGDLFPHEELFRHHLGRPEVAAVRPWIGTLNSLVVDSRWRRRLCSTGHAAGLAAGTVSGLLLAAAVGGSHAAGFRAIVATAQTAISARALVRAGFRVIDPPVHTPLHAVFPMCNVGIVLRTDPGTRALQSYFDGRQHDVLAGRSIDWHFQHAQFPDVQRSKTA